MSRSVSALPLAIDAMGGDHSPSVTVQAAVAAVSRGEQVILVGDREVLQPLIPSKVQIEIVSATDVLRMDEPAAAVRNRKGSTIWVAVDLVAQGRACGVVSCGNSGALFIAALGCLGAIDGVERPGFATLLPRTDGGELVLLDAGANIDCKSTHLVCFAKLGATYARLRGVKKPRVGLLSNGHEATKGNSQVQETLPLLQETGLRVVGHIEPADALAGDVDVLVCDGFVGNILLKGIEAAAELVMHFLKEEVATHLSARLGTALLTRVFRRFSKRARWSSYGGGLLLGVNGVVVVGHGKATVEAVSASIELAWQAVENELVKEFL